MSNDIKKTMDNIKNTFACPYASTNHPTCRSEFQDKRYGKNNRLFTTKTGTNATMGSKMCTVCGKQSN